jgi:hypothetical protein
MITITKIDTTVKCKIPENAKPLQEQAIAWSIENFSFLISHGETLSYTELADRMLDNANIDTVSVTHYCNTQYYAPILKSL